MKKKTRKDIEGLVHLRISECMGTLNSITRSLCNGHSPKANLRAEKKAQGAAKKIQEIVDFMKQRSDLAAQEKSHPRPWEKL